MHASSPKRTITRLTLCAVLLSIILLVSVPVRKMKERDASLFQKTGSSYFTYDNQSNRIDAYRSEKDDVWYLFVPSTVSIPEMTLHYNGAVSAVSEGKLDVSASVITGAFSRSGDAVTVEDEVGATHTVQVMQSSLPSVHIVLNEKTLDDVHADKDTKHKNNSIYIMDPKGTYDLTVEDSVEMKGRGNTTWNVFEQKGPGSNLWMEFKKKGYQIKFESGTSVLGMGEAKKWVLLANAGDDSMMRTALTYRMAENLDMDFVPDMEYVDLWVNGEYLGTYLIGDKVEIGSTRLNMENDLGVLIEQDEAYYADEDWWFFSDTMQGHFVMKEIVEEDDACIEAAMTDVQSALDELMALLCTTSPEEITMEDLSERIDVDSFIKYYLVAEYVLNREAIGSSFYWYKDGAEDVLHLGPLWDYDTCMGNDGAAYTENYAHNHMMFRYLLAIPDFYERTLALKEQYWPHLASMDTDVDTLKAVIGGSAQMNYLRWDVLGTPTNKDASLFADTFEDAADNVKRWLNGRENAFTVLSEDVVYASADGRLLNIHCKDGNIRDNVFFLVWGVENGQNDIREYAAQRDENGILCTSVDLEQHGEYGTYMIIARSGDAFFAKGQAIVQAPDNMIFAEISDDNEMLTVAVNPSVDWENVWFAVWSNEGGQDDLKWYEAQKNVDGRWEYAVDPHVHDSAGRYNIHAYTITNGVYTKLRETTVNVATVNVTVTENNETMYIYYRDFKTDQNIAFAVWSDEDGQDDLQWFAASKMTDGPWAATVDLKNYHSDGMYHVHAYSIEDEVYTKCGEKTISVG